MPRPRCLLALTFFVGVMAVSPTAGRASTPSGDGEANEPQTSEGMELPAWPEGACRESFDIRIWPDEVVIWLEQQQLRDLIADPCLPQKERRRLERILAMQRAWRTGCVPRPGEDA